MSRRDRGRDVLARAGDRPAVRLVLFTLGVCLFLAAAVGSLYGTLAVAGPALGAGRASLLAIVVFLSVVTVPVYVLVARSS